MFRTVRRFALIRLLTVALVLGALAGGCRRTAAPAGGPASSLSLISIGGDAPLDRLIAAAQEATRRAPGDARLWIDLAEHFARKAHASRDSALYGQARDAVDHALALAPPTSRRCAGCTRRGCGAVSALSGEKGRW